MPTINYWIFGIFFLFFIPLFCEETPLFVPPNGWEFALPQEDCSLVQACFKKKGSGFTPSINFAIEKVAVSLEEYLRIVKSNYEEDYPHCTWKNLGWLKSQAGNGVVMEIDLPSQGGDMKLLQFVLFKDQKAYILTGATLKKDFFTYLPIFQKSFESLQFIPDLFSLISNEKKRADLKEMISQTTFSLQKKEENIKSLEKRLYHLTSVLNRHYSEMGGYGHYLILKEMEKQLASTKE
ncbi:MAG: hypothetical protein L0207_05940 [Chlamydiae bacterium]|nr:hypothetical protein [Chlamydiota bacterium]